MLILNKMDLADMKEQQVMPCRAFSVSAPESDRITGRTWCQAARACWL